MRREYVLILFFVIAALFSIRVEAQPSLISFIYLDDGSGDPEPPITNGAGLPVPDETTGLVLHDLGEPGPDPTDTTLGGFGFNGELLGFGAGYFAMEPWIVASAGTSLYVAVVAPNRCWYTVSYVVDPEIQGILIAADEWTMSPPPCPWNLPMASVVFSYCIHPPWYFERPLTCPCDSGPMMPEGTPIEVMHDVNANGPDGMDTSVTSFVPDENVPDCIWVSPWVTLPSDFPVYLQVSEGCCWTTGNYMVTPPQQAIELHWGNWSCSTSPCGLPADEHPGRVPNQFELTAIYPNPFNSVTQIEFALPRAGAVSVDIYDILGQHVTTLANGTYAAGTHTLVWDARNVSSGVYLCRAVSSDVAMTRKLLLLR